MDTRHNQGNPLPGAAADVHAPSSNTAAVVTYAAVPDYAHHVYEVAWSYTGGTVSGGNLKIEDGGFTIFSMDIDARGQGQVAFARPKQGTPNLAMTITLAAGGSGVSGKVSCGHDTQYRPSGIWVFDLQSNANSQYVPLF